jgi:hypothetical protein
MAKRVRRGHRTDQWVTVRNLLVATRETLDDGHGATPRICV